MIFNFINNIFFIFLHNYYFLHISIIFLGLEKIPISPPTYGLWDLVKIRAISSLDMAQGGVTFEKLLVRNGKDFSLYPSIMEIEACSSQTKFQYLCRGQPEDLLIAYLRKNAIFSA